MYAAERAHSTAAYAIRHLLQSTILSYCSLVFFRQRAPTASSANTPSSLVRARSSPTRFTGPSSVSSAPTTLFANATTPLSRDRSAAAHPSTTTSRVSSGFFFRPYTTRFQDQPTACLPHIFAEHHLRIGVSTTPRDRDIFSQGIIALSRTFPFVLLLLPLAMFLEFLLEFFFMGFVVCALGF